MCIRDRGIAVRADLVAERLGDRRAADHHLDPAEGGRAVAELSLIHICPVFRVSAYSGEGIWRILSYLKEPGDRLPWENAEEAERPRTVLSDKYGETGRKRP